MGRDERAERRGEGMNTEEFAKELTKEIKESGYLPPWSCFETDLENSAVFVRDFGSWVNPPDAEDEEDYDWQEPTKETTEALSRICEKMTSLFPSWEVDFSTEEKNWVRFCFHEKELEMER